MFVCFELKVLKYVIIECKNFVNCQKYRWFTVTRGNSHLSASSLSDKNCVFGVGWTWKVPSDGPQHPLSSSAADILGHAFNQMQFCGPRKRQTYGQKLLPWWTLEKNQLNSLTSSGRLVTNVTTPRSVTTVPRGGTWAPLLEGTDFLTDRHHMNGGFIALGTNFR